MAGGPSGIASFIVEIPGGKRIDMTRLHTSPEGDGPLIQGGFVIAMGSGSSYIITMIHGTSGLMCRLGKEFPEDPSMYSWMIKEAYGRLYGLPRPEGVEFALGVIKQLMDLKDIVELMELIPKIFVIPSKEDEIDEKSE